jgi:NAD(P)-dependent dehydrogenase (short-subunit alcohol dehydrogenase family)
VTCPRYPWPDARYYQHDLADIAAIPALLEPGSRPPQGPVDALIQNAGVAAKVRGDMLDLTPENFDWILRHQPARRLLPGARGCPPDARHPGPHYRSITFITSVSAGMASPDRADYCISKAAAAMAAQPWPCALPRTASASSNCAPASSRPA